MSSKRCAIAAFVLLGLPDVARAQIYTGAICGRVTDSTGGVLPGVHVTLSSDRLIQPETTVTSRNGTFRFAELPIGTYRTTFELSGFKTFIREGILLDAGATIPVIVSLEVSSVSETIVVSGETPVVDIRHTGTAQSFDQDRLEKIPTARDPWVLLEQTPGVLVNLQNVGGTESGSQTGHTGRGSLNSQNIWNYDGVEITDFTSTGFSPTYYDFGAFQEVNITTSGQSPRLQTPGNAVNIVVKQGGSAFQGQGSIYGTHHALQSSNIDDELRKQGAGPGTPTKHIALYNMDGGGPIAKDRAWVWGGFGYQDINRGVVGFLKPGCDDPEDVDCTQDHPIKMNHINVKANFQLSSNNKAGVLFSRNDKVIPNRGARASLPTLETTVRQSSATYIYKIEDTHIVSSDLLLTGRFAYVDTAFRFDFQEPQLRYVQPALEQSTWTYSRSAGTYAHDGERPSIVGNFDVNTVIAGKAGGDHEIKFGGQYKRNHVNGLQLYAGDVTAVFQSGQAREARFSRPGYTRAEALNTALYFQDTFTRDRLSLKLGLRFDYQTGKNRPSEIPANLIIPDIMPAVVFPGTEPVNAWKDVSPRLGLTYDMTGDAATLLRAGYSRYASRRESTDIAFNNPVGNSWISYPWTDLNGDRFVQPNEVDTGRILWMSNFDPADPGSFVSPNEIDPDYTAPVTDELILGVEREFVPGFAVGVSYIYRNASNFVWRDGFAAGVYIPYVGVSSSDFVPADVDFEGQTLTYYELSFLRPAGEYLTNWPDYHQTYQAVEVTGRKRLSQGWMLAFGATFASHREYFESEAAVFDPTGVDKRRGEQTMNLGGTSSGLNARWNVKFDAMFELPLGVNLAGTLNGHQGYVFYRNYFVRNRGGGIGPAQVYLNRFGEDRYDDFWIADLRLEKFFDIKGSRLSVMLDMFNLFNAATVLGRDPRQNLASANRIYDILAARIVRFGVRWLF